MHQILHIFRKDLRHFWPESLACVLTTAIFARLYPAQWVDSDGLRLMLGGVTLPAASLETLASIVTALMPITWFVLITRVIQDESLVGERPYWFTRPYEWPKLLAAKISFVSMFLIVPLAIAQAVLLRVAGFSVVTHIPALIYLLLLCVGCFVLPIICLAVITRTFLQASLTLITFCGVMIAAIGILSDDLTSVSIPYSDRLSYPLMVLVGGGVIVSQYASRRTWLARLLLITLLLSITLAASNPFDAHLLEHTYYTSPSRSIPITIAIADGPTADKQPVITQSDNKHELLSLPLAIAGVPYGFWITPDDSRLVLTAADGTRTTVPWQATHGHDFRQGTEEAALSFKVEKAFLDRNRKHPFNLQLSLALTQWEAGTPTRAALPAHGDLVLPGYGICANAESAGQPNASLRCRYPFHLPAKTFISAQVTEDRCPAPPATPLYSFTEAAMTGEEDPDPSAVGLISVWDSTFSFGYQNKSDSNAMANAHLCPGSNITLTPYRVLRRGVYSITIPSIVLPPTVDPNRSLAPRK